MTELTPTTRSLYDRLTRAVIFNESNNPIEATDPSEPGAPRHSIGRANLRRRVLSELLDSDPEPVEIGRYRILARLGAGGMGEVYSAYDVELDRKVAIKLLKRDHADLTERLRREAKALARANHPGIVQAFEIGEHEGQTFLAMEFVDGKTLRRWLAEDQPSVRERIAAMCSAGEALAAAHAAGLVHRDFKPDNVMLGCDGRSRLLDFGLARASGTALPAVDEAATTTGASETLSHTGQVMGTPAYMAPEQMRGSEVDARTDQFAFCIALWEAVYGERPFEGQTLAELGRNVASGRRRDAPALRQAPRWLRPLLDRGLSIDPAGRFPSMDDLLAELSRNRARNHAAWGAAAVLGVFGTAAAASWIDQVQDLRDQSAALQTELDSELARAGELKDSLTQRMQGQLAERAAAIVDDDPNAAIDLLRDLPPDSHEWADHAWAIVNRARLRGVIDRVTTLPEDYSVIDFVPSGEAVLCKISDPVACLLTDPATGRTRLFPDSTEWWSHGRADLFTTRGEHHVSLWRTSWAEPRVLELPETATLEGLVFSNNGKFAAGEARLADQIVVRVWSVADGSHADRTFLANTREELFSIRAVDDDGTTVLASDGYSVWRLRVSGRPQRVANVGQAGDLPNDEGSFPVQTRCAGDATAFLDEDRVLLAGFEGALSWVDVPLGHGKLVDCAHDGGEGHLVVRDAAGRIYFGPSQGPLTGSHTGFGPIRDIEGGVLLADRDGAPIVLDLATGRELVLPRPDGDVRGLTDGGKGLVGTRDDELWHLTLPWERDLTGHQGSVTALLWSAELGLVSGGVDGTVRAWDDEGHSKVILQLPNPVISFAVDEQGHLYVTNTEDETVLVPPPDDTPAQLGPPYSAPSHNQMEADIATMRELEAEAVSLLRPADGQAARVTSGGAPSIATNGSGKWTVGDREFDKMIFRGDRILASYQDDTGARLVWLDAQGRPTSVDVAAPHDPVWGVSATADGQWVVVAGPDGIRVGSASLDDWRWVGSRTSGHLALSREGTLIAGCDGRGPWVATVSGAEPIDLPIDDGRMCEFAFSPDSTRIVTAGSRGPLRLHPPLIEADPATLRAWVAATPRRVTLRAGM